MRRYELAAGDDGAYGPSFGPVRVFELSIVTDSEGSVWQLVQLERSLRLDGQRIEHLVLAPRYKGDSMGKLQKSGCTIGISRVLPGRIDGVRAGSVEGNVEYFAIGKSKRIAT